MLILRSVLVSVCLRNHIRILFARRILLVAIAVDVGASTSLLLCFHEASGGTCVIDFAHSVVIRNLSCCDHVAAWQDGRLSTRVLYRCKFLLGPRTETKG
jgi:hypothetical protein